MKDSDLFLKFIISVSVDNAP